MESKIRVVNNGLFYNNNSSLLTWANGTNEGPTKYNTQESG